MQPPATPTHVSFPIHCDASVTIYNQPNQPRLLINNLAT